MSGQTEKTRHELRLLMRKELHVCGVSDVESFDDTGILLRTTEGEMTVEGSELKIGRLDTESGVVTVTGRIDGILYIEDGGEKRGIFKRLFR